jgi:hypothetical protein
MSVVAGIYFRGGMLRGARDRDETAASHGVFGGRGGEVVEGCESGIGVLGVLLWGWVRRRCGFGKEESCLMHNSTS